MVQPPGEESRDVGSRYALVMAVAKRAKQLRDGAPRLVECESKNTITIALAEFAAGKLKMVVPTAEELEAATQMAVTIREERRVRPEDLLRIPEEEEEQAEVEEVASETPSEETAEEAKVEEEAEAPEKAEAKKKAETPEEEEAKEDAEEETSESEDENEKSEDEEEEEEEESEE